MPPINSPIEICNSSDLVAILHFNFNMPSFKTPRFKGDVRLFSNVWSENTALLKDSFLKSIPIHQNYTMALRTTCTRAQLLKTKSRGADKEKKKKKKSSLDRGTCDLAFFLVFLLPFKWEIPVYDIQSSWRKLLFYAYNNSLWFALYMSILKINKNIRL